MKSPEDVQICREIVARLQDLGMSEEEVKPINDWIDEQEREFMEGCERAGPNKAAPVG